MKIGKTILTVLVAVVGMIVWGILKVIGWVWDKLFNRKKEVEDKDYKQWFIEKGV